MGEPAGFGRSPPSPAAAALSIYLSISLSCDASICPSRPVPSRPVPPHPSIGTFDPSPHVGRRPCRAVRLGYQPIGTDPISQRHTGTTCRRRSCAAPSTRARATCGPSASSCACRTVSAAPRAHALLHAHAHTHRDLLTPAHAYARARVLAHAAHTRTREHCGTTAYVPQLPHTHSVGTR